MREYTVKEYDPEDYENFKTNLSNEQAIELLKRISRGYLPDYNFIGTEDDLTITVCIRQSIEQSKHWKERAILSQEARNEEA